MSQSFMDGNEAMARGAILAGCDFFAGYPITPATTVFAHMLDWLPGSGGLCVQTEDEIAAAGYCLGAAMAGRKVFTATSGPGISLISEQISFAIGSEIPIVVADIQRLGPSTGSATKGADGDIQFLRWGSSGGVPPIVLAPKDVRDSYVLTVHAFNFAEQYRCPVFIASNKEIGMTRESVDLDCVAAGSTVLPAITRRVPHTGDIFLPFKAAPDKAPPFLPIGGPVIVRQTSSTHGPEGYITIDPNIIAASQKRLQTKIHSAATKLALFEKTTHKGSDTLIISYGVTSRAVEEACLMAQKNGRPSLSFLNLKTLWPVPEKLIFDTAAPFKRIVVFEMNMGQYVREIARVLRGRDIIFHGQMNGTLIRPETVLEVVDHGQLFKS